jgi:orotate phosphoribosyltransferase
MEAIYKQQNSGRLRDDLCELISHNSWPCSDVGKWQRAPGIHLGTKEAIFSATGPRIIGTLVHEAILNQDPEISAVAGDGVGGTAIAMAVASVIPWGRKLLIPLHVRLKSEVTRNKLLVEGATNVPLGSRVAVVDDTVDSARSIMRVISILQAAGYVVSAAVFLVSRRKSSLESFGSLGIKAVALFDLQQLNPRESAPESGGPIQ